MDRLKKEGYNVESYAYTKLGDVATNAKGFDTTFSVGANKKEMDKIDVNKQKISTMVPKELFSDLDLMKISDEETLKSRVAKYFNINKNNVITYDEMKGIPKTDKPKWSVIVTPNDGDDAAFRKDVKNVLLTLH